MAKFRSSRGHSLLLMTQGEEAHHKARRAEAALRGVEINHRLLHRMQLAAFGQIFDGDQFLAVDLAEKENAGINGLVDSSGLHVPRPSTTVQAPQSPSLQPSLVPRDFSMRRR